MRWTPWLTGIAVVAILGCSDNNEPDGGGDADATVEVRNNVFDPSSVTVPVGGTVRWNWNSGGTQHNVTFSAGGPNSSTQGSGSFSRTFSAAGTFDYQCTIHAPSMSGTVTVGSSSGTGGDGGGGGEDTGY